MGYWYRTGTLSVANGDTTVTGTTTGWASTVRAGDMLFVDDNPPVEIGAVVSNTELTLVEPFPFTTASGAAYAIAQGLLWNDTTRLGFEVTQALADATEILSGTGVPSDSSGTDGSAYFRQDAPELYFKNSGSWGSPISLTGPQGPAGANNITSSTTSRTLNTGSMAFTVDAGKAFTTGMRLRVANSGSNYMEGVVTSYSGTTLTISMDRFVGSGTYAVWAIAPVGDKGDTGATGASYAGTSTTSLTIGTGSQAFTTQAGLAYVVGSPIRLASAANPANFMEGVVAAYSGTSMTATIAVVGGSGTLTDWNLSLTGRQGATGSTGSPGPANSLSIGTVTTGAAGSSADATITGTAPSQTLNLTIPKGDAGVDGTDGADGSLITATSTTSLTPAVGSLVFTVAAGLSFLTGMRVRGASAANPTTNWFSGIVATYSGTTLTITADDIGSSPISAADWNIAVSGEKGVTGGVASVNGLLPSLGNVSLDAGDIPDTDTPTNYTPSSSDIQGHLQGIDIAIAAAGFPSSPQGRLTLATATAVPTSDQSGQTTIYYTPVMGLNVPLWDGSKTSMKSIGAELSLALDASSGHTGYHQSGKNFDLFVFNDSGTMRLGTGPAWSSDTSRGSGAGTTELELKNGFWVNKNAIALRFGSSSGNTVSVAADLALYVGSFRATADGQASDTKSQRYLWNAYNQAPRSLYRKEVASSWTQSGTSIRQANSNSANKFEFLLGLSSQYVTADLLAFSQNGSATYRQYYAQIGLDSTSVASNDLLYPLIVNSTGGSGMAKFQNYVGLGYHYLAWLENGNASDTVTWYGSGSYFIGTVYA